MLVARCTDDISNLDIRWYHDPLLRTNNGETVAMLTALYGLI